jgi:co-chaperonin GroES (HSP10)
MANRYDYYHTSEDITPIKDHVLVVNMEKGEKISTGGIITLDDNGKDRGIRPRWCQVYKVGPLQQDVKPGQWILVEHSRWTYGVEMTLKESGEEELFHLQRVDNPGIWLVTDECPF